MFSYKFFFVFKVGEEDSMEMMSFDSDSSFDLEDVVSVMGFVIRA